MRASDTRGALALFIALLMAVSAAPAAAQTGESTPAPAVADRLPAGEAASAPAEVAPPDGPSPEDPESLSAEPTQAPAAPAAAPLADDSSDPLADDSPDPLFDDDWDQPELEVNDPLEPGNRAVLAFNRRVDAILWEPLTTGYRFVMPEPGRRSIRRVFTNLYTPVYLVNHLLQARFLDAAETLGAFGMNTVFGLAGVFDAAGAVNIEPRPADFGQTLAVYGVGTGPYLMIPVFGPTTVRDGIGGIVDFFVHPLTYFVGVPVLLVGYGSAGVARREAVADQLAALEESSVDYYAVLRSAYLQAREQSIAECRRRRGDETVALAPQDAAPPPSPGATTF